LKDFTDAALNAAAAAGAAFADVRIVEERENRVLVRRRSLKLVDETERSGFGVRVLLGGAWGFASSTVLGREAAARTAQLAVEAARAAAAVPRQPPAVVAGEPAHTDTRVGPCREDPFAVSNREKADLLLAACDTMLNVPGVATAAGWLGFLRRRRVIANTDGSYLDLSTTFSYPHLEATAVAGEESQERSYPGGARQAGWEFIREIDLPGHARQWAEEAVMKCRAEDCPEGVMDLVLDPMNLALTMHESVGHPTELDRILGWEANMAGRSFVRPADVGTLRYGSERVSFTVDNTLEGGVGSWFYDDDGVPMQRFPLIRDGLLVALSCTRETAPMVGWERSNGCCRSDGFEHVPINRIPNLYLEPGPDDRLSPEDLIAGVERGLYIEGQGSFSIDQMRNNFQFGGDLFWLIEGGRKTRPLKKATYQAQTRQFWASCDAVAGRPWWRPHGVMNCGKGEPMQVMFMTHGASPARFRGIRVGAARL
jgi:TldD protein